MIGHLGVGLGAVRAAVRDLSAVPFARCAAALAADVDRWGPVPATGVDDVGTLPLWSASADGHPPSWPVRAAFAFPAGTAAPVPLVVAALGIRVEVYAAHPHGAAASRYLDDLVRRGAGPADPYRGVVLTAEVDHGFCLELRPTPIEPHELDALVLPDDVEAAVTRHVRELLDRLPLLQELGYGANRGILLAGPPGTGKTALCRRLALELVDRTSVVIVASRALHDCAGDVYEAASHLAPCLVVLEDLDLALSSRERGGASADLMELLVALDGIRTRHTGVVTLATTNNPDGLDPALRRAARFDRVIRLPLPDRTLRGRILAAYLAPVGVRDGLDEVAARTDGASGAELRELVRLGLLCHGRDLTAGHLADLADEGAWRREVPTGAYL